MKVTINGIPAWQCPKCHTYFYWFVQDCPQCTSKNKEYTTDILIKTGECPPLSGALVKFEED